MIYTPYGGKVITKGLDDMGRVHMNISDEDFHKLNRYRGQHYHLTITNQLDGKKYEVESAACGAACYCAAIVLKEIV